MGGSMVYETTNVMGGTPMTTNAAEIIRKQLRDTIEKRWRVRDQIEAGYSVTRDLTEQIHGYMDRLRQLGVTFDSSEFERKAPPSTGPGDSNA